MIVLVPGLLSQFDNRSPFLSLVLVLDSDFVLHHADFVSMSTRTTSDLDSGEWK